MGIIYTEMRLANDAKPELEDISVNALVDTISLATGSGTLWPARKAHSD